MKGFVITFRNKSYGWVNYFQYKPLNKTKYVNESFQKTSKPPPQRKLEIKPPIPLRYPNTHAISETIVSLFPSGRQEFSLWGECGYFLEGPNSYISSKMGQKENVLKVYLLQLSKLSESSSSGTIIIYRPGARGIRRNITRSDDISRGALPRGKYHHWG